MPSWRDPRRGLAAAWLLAGLLGFGLGAGARADPRSPAAAKPPPSLAVLVRGGEHTGFSRLVFDLPANARAELAPVADGLLVRVPGAAISGSVRLRGLLGLVLTGDEARLSWPPGTTPRTMRLPGRLVVDLLPASRRAIRADRAAPGRRELPPRIAKPPAPPPALPPALPPAIASAAPPPAASAPLIPPLAAPVLLAAPVVAVAAAPIPPPPSAGPEPADAQEVTLPFAATTGAAAFRRGDWGVAVFDEQRPVDPAVLRADPALASAQVRALAAATEILVKLGPERALVLAHGGAGWSVAVVAAEPALRAIRPVSGAGRIEFPVDNPGRVIAVADPDTGGLLLVGTEAPGGPSPGPPPPQGLAVERRAPEFTLLATWQGVVVDAASDDLVLREEPGRFVLESSAAGRSLALAAADGADPADEAARFSRRFDLPADTMQALERRLLAATDMTASAPLRDRGPERLRAAQAMLALGMGAEASALVRLAATDDPRLTKDALAQAIGAAGSLLAGRLGEAAAIDDPALTEPGQPGADEVALWRALLAARLSDAQGRADPAAAQILAAKLPLLQAYPAPLRDRLLPLALETMALGGEAAAARRAVDARAGDARLDYARALLDERDGHGPDALARLDRLAQDADREVAARAAVRAVGLRLDAHLLSPTQAADALDRLIYAWRGDGRELAVRLREAALRLQAGQPRAALALLRDCLDPVLSQGWPDQRDAVHRRMARAFDAAIAGDAAHPLAPLEFVAMVQENADLLPDGPAGQALGERVADRLAALDLPDQAAAALARLVDQAPPGAARAALGGRLAALRMEQRNPEAALLTLSASTAEGLPGPLAESRALVFARATAARGDLLAATGALEALGTPRADDLRARLLADAGQWPEATAALQRLALRTLPASGVLDDAQSSLLLRLAAAAAQAGDVPALAELRAHDLSRVPAGRSADLLRVLTEGPVQTVADLPRAGAEMTLARSTLK